MLSIKAKIEQVGLGFLHFIYLFYTFQQRFGSRKAKFAVNSVIVLNEANKGKDSPSFYGNLMLNQWKTISQFPEIFISETSHSLLHLQN